LFRKPTQYRFRLGIFSCFVNVLFDFLFALHYRSSGDRGTAQGGSYSVWSAVPDDFLQPEFRAECEHVLPDREMIRPHKCRDAYTYLKNNFQL